MEVVRAGEVPVSEVREDEEGNPARGTGIQVLLRGPNFVLRVFTVRPGGATPRHRHPWEHEVYVLAGRGRVVGEEEVEVAAGDAVFVPAGELHSFENAGEGELRFICVVPRRPD